MNKQNHTEYTHTRAEIRDVKNCITTYMGYLLGGSGFAFFGLVSLAKNGDASFEYLSYACFLMALIISMVLLLILYKFTSHNRYAGYSKLLNHERYTPLEGHGDMSFISWELCWDRIRTSDYKGKNYLLEKLEKSNIDGIEKGEFKSHLERYLSKDPVADYNKKIEGIKLLANYCQGRLQSRSWVFPAYIFVCCFLLCSVFMAGGVVTGGVFISASESMPILLMILSGIFVALQFSIWTSFCGKLYSLMEGSSTIEGYCIRFVPVRAEYLNTYGLVPDYELLEIG